VAETILSLPTQQHKTRSSTTILCGKSTNRHQDILAHRLHHFHQNLILIAFSVADLHVLLVIRLENGVEYLLCADVGVEYLKNEFSSGYTGFPGDDWVWPEVVTQLLLVTRVLITHLPTYYGELCFEHSRSPGFPELAAQIAQPIKTQAAWSG